MSNYQNPQYQKNMEMLQQPQQIQRLLDALPPVYAVWVKPRKKNRDGLTYADVALIQHGEPGLVLKLIINPDPEIPFNKKESKERIRLINIFRLITRGRFLVFFDADEDLKILNGYVDADADICCIKESLPEAFGNYQNDQLKTMPFSELAALLSIKGWDAPHPALSNATMVFQIWFWCLQDYFANKPGSFQ
jgi:hypothetical protein